MMNNWNQDTMEALIMIGTWVSSQGQGLARAFVWAADNVSLGSREPRCWDLGAGSGILCNDATSV